MVLFRDGVQFWLGLVDLVAGVGRHGGGGHRLALPGERFVGLVSEHIAQVRNRADKLTLRRQHLLASPHLVASDGEVTRVVHQPIYLKT